MASVDDTAAVVVDLRILQIFLEQVTWKPCSHAYRMGAKFHVGEDICHCIVPAMNMTHVRGVFGYEGKVALLLRHPAF